MPTHKFKKKKSYVSVSRGWIKVQTYKMNSYEFTYKRLTPQ